MNLFTEEKKAIMSAKDMHFFDGRKRIVIKLQDSNNYKILNLDNGTTNEYVADLLTGEKVWESE